MSVRRKRLHKRPPSNRWPDFVRFVAWPLGERFEAELWAHFFVNAHYFSLTGSFVVLLHNLTTNEIESFPIVVAVIMALPFVSFTISDYCYS